MGLQLCTLGGIKSFTNRKYQMAKDWPDRSSSRKIVGTRAVYKSQMNEQWRAIRKKKSNVRQTHK